MDYLDSKPQKLFWWGQIQGLQKLEMPVCLLATQTQSLQKFKNKKKADIFHSCRIQNMQY